jgi:hypothetical protein
MMKAVFFTLGLLISSSIHGSDRTDSQLDLALLKNPVWQSKDNLRDPSVLKTQDGYRHLALATSTDLRQWNLQGPIELPRQQWMSRKYGAPFVWRDGTRGVMILMGENSAGRTAFGLLSSPDGRRWTLLPE